MSWKEPAHDTRGGLAATRHINQATDGNYVAAVSHLNKHKSQPCHERSEGEGGWRLVAALNFHEVSKPKPENSDRR